MKNKNITKTGFIATFLSLSLLAVPAMADETDEKRAKWREHIQKFDRDGDGRLNEAERQALKESRRAKMLEKFDTDGDGKLSNGEKQAARKAYGKYLDKREDVRDRREDIRDQREDRRDSAREFVPGTPQARWDRREDVRDRREDFRDLKPRVAGNQ